MAVAGVVGVLEVGDPDFGVEEGEPLVHVQAFLADPVVERLDKSVAPWFTWWDVADANSVFAELSQGVGNEFGAVVAANQHRQTPLGNDELQRSDEVFAGDRPVGQVE